MLTRRTLIKATVGAAALSALAPGFSMAQAFSPQEVFFDKDAPVLGNPKGDVTIVEFFDYQCPYCKKNHPTMKSVVESDGNVRLVMKDWPVFGEASVYASQAVLGAAAIGQYEPALDALMKLPGRLTEEDIQNAFKEARIPMQDVIASVNNNAGEIGALLDRNYQQALAFNFAGTPSFVIGKTLYPGALDKAGLIAAIAKARKA